MVLNHYRCGLLIRLLVVVGAFQMSGGGGLSQNTNPLVRPQKDWPTAPEQTNGMTRQRYEKRVGPLMLAEASFYVRTLNLSEHRPFNPYVTKLNLNPPGSGSLGWIETAMYHYSFPGSDTKPITNDNNVEWFLEPGKLAYVTMKEPFALVTLSAGSDPMAINRRLAELKNRLTTNSAYQLATQWLRSVEVDVDALEKKYPPQTSQQFFYDAPITWKPGETPPPDTPKKLLPIFDVTWGGDPESTPPVWVEIDGTGKSLIHLRLEDTRFSRRRPIVFGGEDSQRNTNALPKKQLKPFLRTDLENTNTKTLHP